MKFFHLCDLDFNIDDDNDLRPREAKGMWREIKRDNKHVSAYTGNLVNMQSMT